MLKLFLLCAGLLALGFIVWHIGPERIYDVAAQLGPVALLVMLIPSVIMYVVEAYGWKVTLGPSAKDLPFWRVLAIKTAGEVVNMTTPAGYLGGEPLKAYLLTKYHVPIGGRVRLGRHSENDEDDCRSALSSSWASCSRSGRSAPTAHPGRRS